MNVLEFPSQVDIKRIYDTTSFEKLNKLLFDWLNRSISESGFGLSGLKMAIDTRECIQQLHYRLMDVAKSYALLSYFFEKGIPDEEWYISPGKSGASIEYFPDFEPVHFAIKDWFDYYSNTFYYTFFSTLDMVGHLLNIQYALGMKQQEVSFHQVVNRLSTQGNSLYVALDEIKNSSAFQEVRRLRNDITHNYLPSSTGIAVTITEKGGDMGFRDYTPSAAIVSNVQEAISLLEKIIILVTT